MIRVLFLFVLSLLAGCNSAIKPLPCDVMVKGECREMTASEKSGAGSRGHINQPEETK